MCKTNVYLELQKRYENLEANLSVKEFYEQNKSLCTRHSISLRALQLRASRDKWQILYKKIENIEQKIEDKTQEIIEQKADKVNEIAEQTLRITKLALNALEDKLNKENPDIQEIKAALDISGLKKETIDNNINTSPFKVEIVE